MARYGRPTDTNQLPLDDRRLGEKTLFTLEVVNPSLEQVTGAISTPEARIASDDFWQ